MTAIRTLLIANRGEIACRIIRTAREMGIRTVAVYSEPDRLALHVREADIAVPLGGSTAAESYLARDEILKACEWQGADAIHPGYGFLSESASFARAAAAAGLTWVGPPPDAISAMGDKIAAKRIAGDAGLPILPSTELVGDGADEWTALTDAIGYPLLVKAAAGGGGRGMRLVEAPDDLADAVASARREAAASFGNATVFAERYLPAPRHVEIQIVADAHGNVVHLGERECSIQRRHQKIVEEAPSVALDADLRAQMGAAAIGLARSIGYVSTGTVEFLLDDSEEPEFWFLEMNTRLQVEHPVTEAVTGLDLVRLQLEIASGTPLPITQDDVGTSGYAVEVRLYAEDPEHDWLPSVGPLHRWRHGETPGVRYDDGVVTGNSVSPYYDPLLSKVVAHAATRSEATLRLARALREMQIHGVTTNRDYLVEVLTSEEFLAGDTHTDFVERHPPVPTDDDPALYARRWQHFNAVMGPHLAAAALARPPSARATDPWPFVASGWRNVFGAVKEMRPGGTFWQMVSAQSGFATQTVGFLAHGERWEVAYARVARDHPLATRRRQERAGNPPSELFNVAINGPADHANTLVEVIRLDDEVALVHFGRRGHRCTVNVVGDLCYVNSAYGQSAFREVPRFASHATAEALGGPTAPVPGRITAVEVAAGDAVTRGQTLVVLEAMKVEHRVTAAADGVVAEVLVAVGDNVDTHQLLVRLDDLADVRPGAPPGGEQPIGATDVAGSEPAGGATAGGPGATS